MTLDEPYPLGYVIKLRKEKGDVFPLGLNDTLITCYRERQIKFHVLKLGCTLNEIEYEQQRARLFVAANCLIDHDWIKAVFADEVK